MKYRPKHVKIIEAVQWIDNGDVRTELIAMGCKTRYFSDAGLKILAGVDGAQGYVSVPTGHWIIKGAPNDFWPVENEYFLTNYEPVED